MSGSAERKARRTDAGVGVFQHDRDQVKFRRQRLPPAQRTEFGFQSAAVFRRDVLLNDPEFSHDLLLSVEADAQNGFRHRSGKKPV